MMKDGCKIDKGRVIVDDNTRKLGAPNLCLNYNTNQQLHNLDKKLGVECMTGHDQAIERLNNSPRLVSKEMRSKYIDIWERQLFL